MLASYGAERLSVSGCLTAVHVEHAEARFAVRVEEDAVQVVFAAHEDFALQEGVTQGEHVGRVGSRYEVFDAEAEESGYGQVVT